MLFIVNKIDLDDNKVLGSVIENEQHFIEMDCPSYTKFELNHTEQIYYNDPETHHNCSIVVTRIN